MTWSNRVMGFMKEVLVLVALAVALFAWVGCLTMLRHLSCDELDAVRVSHLELGHATPGPGSIYVIGVGPGPPRSEILEYLEAEEAMKRAGC